MERTIAAGYHPLADRCESKILVETVYFSKGRLRLAPLLLCVQVTLTFAASQHQALQEHTKRGIAYFQQGKLAAAEQEFRKALQANPNVPELQDLMGVILDRQGKHQRATAYLLNAIELNPRYAPAYHHLGLNYLHLKRLKLASQAFAKSLELDPNQPVVHNNIGSIYVQNQQYSLALQSFEKANRQDPSNPNILFNLLRAEVRLDRKQSAGQHAEEIGFHRPMATWLRDLAGNWLSTSCTQRLLPPSNTC